MCHKTPMINKRKTSVTLKPSRKIRTRTRKPKFLSLRLQLSPENNQMPSTAAAAAADDDDHQLTLFPLHPENFVGADRDTHDENVADFFSAADGGATSLTGLLDEEEDTVSPPSYAYVAQDREEGNPLLRTALRNRERDGGAVEEEKWVCYSEVVERKEEEVSSCAADLSYANESRSLALKLDYEQILNAWSDKGSLYIHVESPQTVPDLHHTANGHIQSWDNNGGLWTVPEMSGSNSSGHGSMQVKMEAQGEEWKMTGQREASVLRYKEKRRNRLFSKKIRYEVRKLNAEKRPRIKGRFVKRS